MKTIFKLISLMLSVSVLLSVSGCGDSNSNRALIYETVTNMVNIDPQLAVNDTELQIVYNTYEGLMKYNKAGVLTCGVAESYKVSNDKKTYTFKLKENSKWSDGRPLTAWDFLFAFRRAVNSETASPYASTLLPIKNVSKILAGKKPIDSIGVKVISTYELEIQLDSINSSFLNLLTTPVTMPCNEDFFNSCKGYYGLNEDSVLSNGYYKVSAWNEKYCSLKANEEYELYKSAEIGSAYIYFNTEDELFENIKKEEPDFTILDKAMLDRLSDSEIEFTPTHIGNVMNSLIINPKSKIAEANILKALMGTVSYNIDPELTLKYGISVAKSILPTIVNYSDDITIKKPSLDNNTALEFFIKGCDELNVERIFPAFSIVYIDNDLTELVAKQIAANWQNIFGVTVNITALADQETFNLAISSGNYDAAIMPTKAISASPTAYLQQFSSSSNTNLINHKNKDYDKAIGKMNGITGDELNKATKKSAEILGEFDYLYPLFISSKTYYFGKDILPQINNQNQMVYFSQSVFGE